MKRDATAGPVLLAALLLAAIGCATYPETGGAPSPSGRDAPANDRRRPDEAPQKASQPTIHGLNARQYVEEGSVKLQLGYAKDAISDFNHAIKLDPAFVAAWVYRGFAKAARGHLKAALKDFEQALELDPDSLAAYLGRANVEYELGDLEKAAADLDQAINLNPDIASCYRSRAQVKAKSGDLAGALADHDRVIQIDPKDARAYYHRSVVREQLGDVSGAIADMRECLKAWGDRDKREIQERLETLETQAKQQGPDPR